MRKTIIVSTTAALVLGLASVNLVAQRPQGPGRSEGRERPGVEASDAQRGPRRGSPDGTRPGPRGGGPFAFGVLPGALSLTADQRAKVRDIVADARAKSAPIAGDLRAAEAALRAAIFAETPSGASARDAAAKVTELRRQMADIRVNASVSIADVLTPEQREKVRAGRRGPDDGRGGPGRGPGRRPAPTTGD